MKEPENLLEQICMQNSIRGNGSTRKYRKKPIFSATTKLTKILVHAGKSKKKITLAGGTK